MALRLDYGIDVPGSDQTAVMPLPEQTPMAAPLTGLPAALPQATPGSPAMLPSGSSDFYDAIKKALILELQQATQPQQQQEPKKGLGWMALIPGYAEGLQQRQAFEQHQETLKLQQQAMKGQQASQQLQRLVTLHTLQQQQQQEEMGKQVGQLFAQGRDMTDPAVQQQVFGAMARAGLPLDQLLKLQQTFAAQRELSQNAQVGAGGAPGAPMTLPQTEGAALGIVGHLPNGRPIVRNPDGSVSTHRNTIVNFDNDYYVIPTMFGGKQVPIEEAVARVKAAGFKDPETGETLYPYRSLAEAQQAEANQHRLLEQQTGQGAAPTGMSVGMTNAVPATVSPSFAQKVGEVAQRLGMDPTHLMQIMNFETGGTFSTGTRNQAGSGATGLIQFLPSTAEDMGTSTQQLAKMTPEQQLGYVEQYLTPYKGKLGNLQDAYMAVLSPKAIGKAPDTVLFKRGTPEYLQNAGLDRQGKGTVTVADATQAVTDYAQRTGLGGPAQGPGGGPTYATSAGALAPPGQPSRGQEAMQLDLARLMARREQLMQVQQALRALRPITEAGRKDIDTRMDNVRQDLTALNTNIQQVQQQMEPGDLFKSMLRQNQGNLALTQQQYMAFEIEKARRTQEAGLTTAAQKAAETERARMEATQAVRGEQTLDEVQKDQSGNYLDTRTGEPINQATLYKDALAAMKAGTVKRLTEAQVKQYDQIQSTVPVLGEIRTLLDRVYEPGGIFENLSPEERAQAAVRGGWARLTQTNPDLVELNRLMAGNIDFIRRNFQGQVGTQTEGDAKRGLAAMADVTGIPDSKEVAYRLYNTMLETVNRMQGRLLGNKRFQNSELAPLGRSRPGALTTQEEGLLQKYQR